MANVRIICSSRTAIRNAMSIFEVLRSRKLSLGELHVSIPGIGSAMYRKTACHQLRGTLSVHFFLPTTVGLNKAHLILLPASFAETFPRS